jgi:hypothetical protein
MEQAQFFIIMATLLGVGFALLRSMKETMNRMEDHHREDIKEIKASHKLMNEKWERLFERLLLKD